MVHMASSQRSCADEAEEEQIDVTGCIGPFYLNFTIFIVLDPNDILVF
jgi:hypothetical protein